MTPSEQLRVDFDAFVRLGEKTWKLVNARPAAGPASRDATTLFESFQAIRAAPTRVRAPHSANSPFGVLRALDQLDRWARAFDAAFDDLRRDCDQAGTAKAFLSRMTDDDEAARQGAIREFQNTLKDQSLSDSRRAEVRGYLRDARDGCRAWRRDLRPFGSPDKIRLAQESLFAILDELSAGQTLTEPPKQELTVFAREVRAIVDHQRGLTGDEIRAKLPPDLKDKDPSGVRKLFQKGGALKRLGYGTRGRGRGYYPPEA